MMNERIKELANKAGIKLIPMVVDGVEYEYEDVDMDGSEDLEKFAKLIVKECQYAIVSRTDLPKHERKLYNNILKEHFGVE